MHRAQSQKIESSTNNKDYHENFPPPNRLRRSGLLAVLAVAGCNSDQAGSPYHPGPVAGTVVGETAGVVAGNAIGFAGGAVIGTIDGTKKVLNPTYRMVRYWRGRRRRPYDGRTIQVPLRYFGG